MTAMGAKCLILVFLVPNCWLELEVSSLIFVSCQYGQV